MHNINYGILCVLIVTVIVFLHTVIS